MSVGVALWRRPPMHSLLIAMDNNKHHGDLISDLLAFGRLVEYFVAYFVLSLLAPARVKSAIAFARAVLAPCVFARGRLPAPLYFFEQKLNRWRWGDLVRNTGVINLPREGALFIVWPASFVSLCQKSRAAFLVRRPRISPPCW